MDKTVRIHGSSITALDMINSMYRKYGLKDLCLTNTFVYSKYESDFVRITPSMYVHEFEVKMSRSDFLADFKKFKHVYINGVGHVENKHEQIETGQSKLASFSFITPEGLLKEEDIPSYCGWYEAYMLHGKTVTFRIKIDPPRLKGATPITKEKMNKLLRSVYYHHRVMTMRDLQKKEIKLALGEDYCPYCYRGGEEEDDDADKT